MELKLIETWQIAVSSQPLILFLLALVMIIIKPELQPMVWGVCRILAGFNNTERATTALSVVLSRPTITRLPD